jgi:thioredoxin reductase (NADPH)
MPENQPCKHLRELSSGRAHAVRPRSRGCEECLAEGGDWVHLRLCLTCGHVGCCDSSPKRHATAHFHATSHRIMKSYEPGEDWAWCYEDEQMVDQIPSFPEESPRHHLHSPAEAR